MKTDGNHIGGSHPLLSPTQRYPDRIKTALFSATLTLALVGSCLGQIPASDAKPQSSSPADSESGSGGVTVLHNVEIGTGGGRPLHAEVAYPAATLAVPTPAILLLHGGGWIEGTYKTKEVLYWASKGYFCASTEYRLIPEGKWPAQIEDSKLAVRWIRANAAAYNVNPDRIGCLGHSAGGHLVACLGTMDDPSLEGSGGYQDVSSKVQAVVDKSGPTDFLPEDNAGFNRENIPPVVPLLFGSMDATVLRKGSPIAFVKEGNPPFLVIHGDQDKTVPLIQSEKFVVALRQANVPVQFIIVKNADHSFRSMTGSPVDPDSQACQDAALGFFDVNLKK